MKGLKTLLGIALATTGFGGAVAAGVASTTIASNNAQMAEAAGTISSVTLKGSFDTWGSGTAFTKDANGDYSLTKSLSANTEFKIFVTGGGDEWVGDNWGISSDNIDSTFVGSSGQNFKALSAQTFVFKVKSSFYTNYGSDVTIGASFTVTKYAVEDGTYNSTSIGSDTVNSIDTYDPKGVFKSGYSFGGWYTDKACNTSYTAKKIKANTSLYGKYTHTNDFVGNVHVDLRTSTLANSAANYAVYFWNNDYSPVKDGWTNYVAGASNERLLTFSYDLDFEPLKMIVVRYVSTYTQSEWNTEKWPKDNKRTGQTGDSDFNEMVRLNSDYSAYLGYPKVMGGSPWGEVTLLDSVKSNGSHHAEYYSSVTLSANQEFKIQVAPYADGDYYGSYSTHASLTAKFTTSNGNIKALEAGTYSFYFDSYSNSVYITTVALASADEWAQYFLTNVGCDETGAALPTGWNDCATEYGKLSGDAKNIIYGTTAGTEGYVAQAVARYDHAVKAHPSLTKFIVNSSNVVRASAPTTIIMTVNKYDIAVVMAIIVTSTIALSFVCGYFILRKKRFEK